MTKNHSYLTPIHIKFDRKDCRRKDYVQRLKHKTRAYNLLHGINVNANLDEITKDINNTKRVLISHQVRANFPHNMPQVRKLLNTHHELLDGFGVKT